MDIVIKELTVDYAKESLIYAKSVGSETEFLLMDENGVGDDEAEQELFIKSSLISEDRFLIGAFYEERLIGLANIAMPTRKRINHTADIGMSVLREFWGKGVGELLMLNLISIAKKHKHTKLIKLEVRSDNIAAKMLYNKYGFIKFGELKNAIKLADNRYADIDYMVLDLKSHPIIFKSERLNFSIWNNNNFEDAYRLFSDEEVCKYITSQNVFTKQQIKERIKRERQNFVSTSLQYFPLYIKETGEFIGACGARPSGECEGAFEMGFYLLPKFVGKGYGKEAATAFIQYALKQNNVRELFAGHNPDNKTSAELLKKLGFVKLREELFQPTGLIHPFYQLKQKDTFL